MNYCESFCRTIQRLCNSGGGLPSIYQQVEYIESTGTQYINTGTIPAASDLLSVDYQFTNTTDYNNVVTYIDDGVANTNAYGFAYGKNPDRPGYAYVCGWSNFTLVQMTGYGDRHTVEINNGVFTLDGNIIATKSGSITFNKQLYVAAWNRNNTVVVYGKVRIYSFALTSTNAGKLDLIPCYRKSDNKPGMYDLVTNTFFTNAGTGEFTVGNNV